MQKTATHDHNKTIVRDPEENSTAIVTIVEFGVTKKRNAARESEMKSTKTSTPTTRDNDEMTVETTQETTETITEKTPEIDDEMTAMTNPSTIRNWFAKYADTLDTPQRVVTNARKVHLHIGMYPMTNKIRQKTMSSEGNSNDLGIHIKQMN